VFVIVIVPLLLLLAFLANTDSIIKIPPGRVGLLLVHGRATDKVILPGIHWVPRLRKRMVAEYPSLELSFRAVVDGATQQDSGEFDRAGPPVRVTLGDRTQATIGYTIRFRLDEAQLRSVHERFGPEGFWTAVRDISARAVRVSLGASNVGVDDLFGSARNSLEDQLGEAVSTILAGDGVSVTMFTVGDVDLGRTGEVIQSTVRARLELEREEAETALRTVRARIDSELEPYLASVSDTALRYREVDVLRDLAHAYGDRLVTMRRRSGAAAGEAREQVLEGEATEPPAEP